VGVVVTTSNTPPAATGADAIRPPKSRAQAAASANRSTPRALTPNGPPSRCSTTPITLALAITIATITAATAARDPRPDQRPPRAPATSTSETLPNIGSTGVPTRVSSSVTRRATHPRRTPPRLRCPPASDRTFTRRRARRDAGTGNEPRSHRGHPTRSRPGREPIELQTHRTTDPSAPVTRTEPAICRRARRLATSLSQRARAAARRSLPCAGAGTIHARVGRPTARRMTVESTRPEAHAKRAPFVIALLTIAALLVVWDTCRAGGRTQR